MCVRRRASSIFLWLSFSQEMTAAAVAIVLVFLSALFTGWAGMTISDASQEAAVWFLSRDLPMQLFHLLLNIKAKDIS